MTMQGTDVFFRRAVLLILGVAKSPVGVPFFVNKSGSSPALELRINSPTGFLRVILAHSLLR